MTQSLYDVVVFDLDDTLYKERLFVESGFKAVAKYLGNPTFVRELIAYWDSGQNAFDQLINTYSLQCSVGELLDIYRSHAPSIQLDESTAFVLDDLAKSGRILGIITDGRTETQRNKIEALDLYKWFSTDNIVISEEFGSSKPDIRNYRFFMSKYPGKTYAYVGDNISKDFIAPKLLGWRTICLRDNGQNIHSQKFEMSAEYVPDIIIPNITAIKDII